MRTNERIIASFIVAVLSTLALILKRIYSLGGHSSDGINPMSYDWSELYGFIPEFLSIFFIVFIGSSFLLLINTRINMICPSCEKSFSTFDMRNPSCPKCGTAAEELEGFYERHPELKNNNKNTT